MWITSNISGSSGASVSASKGSVAGVSEGCIEMDSAALNKDMTIIAPYGIMYAPPRGTASVMMPVAGGDVCIGVVAEKSPKLQPGEIMLCSMGGASIKLCNDGRVLINGCEAGGF